MELEAKCDIITLNTMKKIKVFFGDKTISNIEDIFISPKISPKYWR